MKEETMGKRIAAHRKRLKLTQEALAERLGITAQAVSKWENDLSCPDITMIPKLAELFGITTDALLGVEPQTIHEAEVVEEEEPEGIHIQCGDVDLTLGKPNKGKLGLAVWVIITGALLLAGQILHEDVSFWNALWSSALLTFGLLGIWPVFSVFRLGCALVGAYFALVGTGLLHWPLQKGWLLPICLLIFGAGLLLEGLRKKKNPMISVIHGVDQTTTSTYDQEDEQFECTVCFGEKHQRVSMPRLSGGSATVSFGQLTLDLSGCQEICDDCELELISAFGQLTVCVPAHWRAELDLSTAFANIRVEGEPAADASRIVRLEGNASFGQITIVYLS